MRLRRIAVWSILVLLVSTATAGIWLWTADLGFVKTHVERWVSDTTGRDFAIDGQFSVDLAGQSTVIAEDIRFSNAVWAETPQMITVGRAEVRIDLWSIFSGPFIIELIDVDGVGLNLVAREDGDPNWVLNLPPKKESQPIESDETVFGILIRQIDIDDVQAVFQSPDRDGPLHLDLEYFDQQHRSDDFLEIRSKATLNNRKIVLDGEAGTWAALLNGKDVRYAVEAQFDSFELSSEGRIDDIREPNHPSLVFKGTGPDINDLSKMLNIAAEGKGDIDVSASLGPADDGSLILAVAGNIGQTNIEASGAFSGLQDLNNVDLNLLAAGPDLGRLSNLVGIKLSEKSPFRIDVDAKRQGPLVLVERAEVSFGEAELEATARIPEFPSLNDSRINLSLRGPRIERFRYATGLPGAATGAFSLDFAVDVVAGGAEVITLDLRTALGKIQAHGLLGDAPGFVGSEMQIEFDIDSLEQVSRAYGIRALPNESLTASGRVSLVEEGIRTLEPLHAQTEAAEMSLDGLVTMQPGLLGSAVNFDVSGPSLSELVSHFADVAGVPSEDFELSGRLQIDNDGYRFQDAAGSLGSTILGIDGLLVTGPGLGGSNFEFSISGPSIEELLSDGLNLRVASGRFELSGRIDLHEDQVDLKNIVLNRDSGAIDLDLQLGLPVSRRWVNFNTQARGGNIRSLLDEFSIVTFDELPFSLDARGKIRGTASSIDVLRATVGEASVEAHGDLNLGETDRSTDFEVNVNIPSLAELGLISGRRLREQSIALEAEITGRRGALSVDDFAVNMGESDIRGSVHYELGEIPKLAVDVFSDSIVFAPLLEEVETTVVAEPKFNDGRLIPDIHLPFEALKILDMSLDIDIGVLRRDALVMSDIDLQVELQNGVLDIKKLALRGRSGYLQSRGRLDSQDGVGRASLEMMSRGFELGITGLAAAQSAKNDIELVLSANGNNLRTLLGNLNGFAYVDARGGQSRQNSFLNVIYGDMLNEIFRTINPFYKSDPYTRFECIITPVVLTDGELTTTPRSFIRTDKIEISAKPEVNLKTEKLEVMIRTTPRKGIVISAGELFNPFIKVTGKLSRPYLAVDEQGVLISGGAAVATGGLSILAKGVWDRMSRSKDPCAASAAAANDLLGERFPVFDDMPDDSGEIATIN